MLAKLMSQYWWVLLLRGLVAILFGVAAYTWPGLTLATLVTVFSFYILFDGFISVFQAFGGRKENEYWWVVLLEGLIGIAFGLITLQAPAITVLTLTYFIGFWAMATGVMRIILALRLRREIDGEWWMVLSALVGIAFGVLVIARPGAGVLSMLTVLAIWAVVIGISLVVLSFKVKSVGGQLGDLKRKLATA
jgi:uncharacterized membrane protein HdeD (DUF308 family)